MEMSLFIAPVTVSTSPFTAPASTSTTWKPEIHAALIPHIGFTIEPGIYLPTFGVRLEINVYIHEDHAEVTTLPWQDALTMEEVGHEDTETQGRGHA